MIFEWLLILSFILIVTKIARLFKLLRNAFGLLILDKGILIAIQLVFALIMFWTINYLGTMWYISAPLLILQIWHYFAGLLRLSSLQQYNSVPLLQCYLQVCKKIVPITGLLLVFSGCAAMLIFTLQHTQQLIFYNLGINFFSKSTGVLLAWLLFGIFEFFSYYVAILVLLQNLTLREALIANYRTVQQWPLGLIVQISVLMLLPAPFMNFFTLPAAIALYLWLLLGNSFNVVLYNEWYSTKRLQIRTV